MSQALPRLMGRGLFPGVGLGGGLGILQASLASLPTTTPPPKFTATFSLIPSFLNPGGAVSAGLLLSSRNPLHDCDNAAVSSDQGWPLAGSSTCLGAFSVSPPLLLVSSIQFSRSVVSDSLRPHELQHTRPPCPSPAPEVHPNPCPLSQ